MQMDDADRMTQISDRTVRVEAKVQAVDAKVADL